MLQAKNEKGLSLLYDQYAPNLLGLIVGIVHDKSVGEEILQKAMLKIWNNIDQYDATKSTLFTWMAAIARNSAIDKRRLVSFQQREKTDTLDPSVYTIKTVQTSTSAIDVDKLTEVLDKKYKDVLDHIYVLGYSQSETSMKLNIPLGTVKTRLRTAINILKAEVKNEKTLFLGLLLIILILTIIL